MKVMVIGNGGREHAIAWKISQSDSVSEVICVPGNGGTAFEKKCRNVEPGENSYAKIARENGCDFAVVGPEDPLAQGVADSLWNEGIPAVGPKKIAAQLESSKDFAKSFMKKYGVACAKSETFTSKDEAISYVKKIGAPIVLKADGLAAGKGVVVAKTLNEALSAVENLMDGELAGDAGKKIVVEEYLRGKEISVLSAVCVTEKFAADGKACIVPFLAARDHKRLLDGALGPNTGGMGAVSPVEDATPEIMEKFRAEILEPTLNGLIAEKFDYRGFIFFGIMLTENGPKCLEYNVRLGDPETQAVLPLMDSDFAELCISITDGTLKNFPLSWKKGFVVSPVAVSGGYPKSYKKGMEISVESDEIEKIGAKIFIAGAIADRRKGADGKLVTSGGRVLACSCYGETFDEAWKKSYQAMACVDFKDKFFRKDIGLPGAAESN
jgi:phosphoribosylamine--glycine ligase